MPYTCRHCSAPFAIDEDDLTLLAKLSPKIADRTFVIPPPTLCPQCRLQRRMSFRNERHLYRRKCDVTGKEIISVFAPGSPFKVCDRNHWYSDHFDPMTYGRPYDPSRSFFEQFRELSLAIPLPSLRIESSENCDFNNDVSDCKNCYLCSRTHQCQDMLNTYRGNTSNDCCDCTEVTRCSFLYDCTDSQDCQDCRSLSQCTRCANSSYLLDCHGCMDCFMCTNLRNKRYCFLNEELTPEAYRAKVSELDTGSHTMADMAKKMFEGIRAQARRRARTIEEGGTSTGDAIFNSDHCHECFAVQQCQDCRYLYDVKKHRDSMDEYSGGRNSELLYETTSGSGSYGCSFCLRASDSRAIRYSWFVTTSEECFGCIGLKRATHCILNTQYSREEYETLVAKIIERMKECGEYGEFFPTSLSPFPYNDTVAQEHMPLTPEQVMALGGRWQESEPRIPKEQAYSVPDHIRDTADDVVTATLSCGACGKNYRIVNQELAFHRRFNLPIPRTCVDCRFSERSTRRSMLRLRETRCSSCGQTILTSVREGIDGQILCERCFGNV